jgi:hypothetical protein
MSETQDKTILDQKEVKNKVIKDGEDNKDKNKQSTKPKSKKGMTKKIKKSWKKFVNSSEAAVLNKVLDQFEKKLSKCLETKVKEMIQKSDELMNILNNIIIPKSTIEAALKNCSFEDFIEAATDKILNLTDLTDLKALISSIDDIKELKEIEDLVKNFCKLCKEQSSEKEESSKLDSTVEKISHQLAKYMANRLVEAVRENVLSNSAKKSGEEAEEEKPEKVESSKGNKNDDVSNDKSENDEQNKKEDKKSDKTPKSKSKVMKAIKKPFKRLLSSSKAAIFVKILDNFREPLITSLETALKLIIETNEDLKAILSATLVSGKTIKNIIENCKTEDFIAAATKTILALTDVTNLDALKSTIEQIKNLEQLTDLVVNLCKALQETLLDAKNRKEVDEESAIDEFCHELAEYVTNLLIDYIKEKVLNGDDEEKKADGNSEDKTGEAEKVKKKSPKKSNKRKLKKGVAKDVKKIIEDCPDFLDQCKSLNVDKKSVKKFFADFESKSVESEELGRALGEIGTDSSDLNSIGAALKGKQFQDFLRKILEMLKSDSTPKDDKDGDKTEEVVVVVSKGVAAYIAHLVVDKKKI